ncbi:cytokine-inducible SH2-containing protein-like [Oncorhynchus kisutch]|uniref:cytokine-inducible SH2-containing protein-like n=1 Tax=Oncorhynchus kisutch TaxID=8019 RepID=UPI0012DC20F2|nr:cytokine-inducible SH2-containing protein-like [Oncorhynchus kisutch]
MIIPTSAPDKYLNAIRLKDCKLESCQSASRLREDVALLQRAMSHLRESGWYWGPLTATQAKQVLIKAPEGTFLLRDSSYQGYLLTLSVKTSLGPTHLHIEHGTGMFGFDPVIVSWPRMRRVEGAVDLVPCQASGQLKGETQSSKGNRRSKPSAPCRENSAAQAHLPPP